MKLPSPEEIGTCPFGAEGCECCIAGARAAMLAVAKALREDAKNLRIPALASKERARAARSVLDWAMQIEQAAAAKEDPKEMVSDENLRRALNILANQGSISQENAESAKESIDTEQWIADTAHALAMKLGYAYKEGWAKELIANNLRDRLPLILGRGK